jgi:hypothetical protein
MKPIQVVLLALMIAGFWVYVQFLRSRSRDRMFVAALFVGSALLVLMPNLASYLAIALQVGRGVDLVMYLAILFLGLLNLVLYSRYRQLRQQFVKLARHMAIVEAEQPAAPRQRDEP